MANIKVDNLANELCKEVINAYEVVKDKLPEIRDIDRNPERLLNLQGENADILGALFKDSIGQAEYICRNGRAITQCAAEIGRINKKVGLALCLGAGALALGYYCWTKIQNHQANITSLEARVAELEGKPENSVQMYK